MKYKRLNTLELRSSKTTYKIPWHREFEIQVANTYLYFKCVLQVLPSPGRMCAHILLKQNKEKTLKLNKRFLKLNSHFRLTQLRKLGADLLEPSISKFRFNYSNYSQYSLLSKKVHDRKIDKNEKKN